MTDSVCRALGVDRTGLKNSFIIIEERHGCDANFLINTVLSRSLEERRGIILVLFHNTFGHYHNIGMKLGYNLNVLQERGEITIVEPMKYIVLDIDKLSHDSVDAKSPELTENISRVINEQKIPNPMEIDENLVQHLFIPLRDQYSKMKKIRPEITVIIDDISHLLDVNLNIKEIWLYFKYLNTLRHNDDKMSVCILTHSYQTDAKNCNPNILAMALKRLASLYIAVEPLSTGNSNDISGVMHVIWRVAELRKKYNWANRITYHYKLLDRQINLFTPGGNAALS